jgi:hypothetical protein
VRRFSMKRSTGLGSVIETVPRLRNTPILKIGIKTFEIDSSPDEMNFLRHWADRRADGSSSVTDQRDVDEKRYRRAMARWYEARLIAPGPWSGS